MADRRYAIRVTGPAGHCRYVTWGGNEIDDPERAYHYRDPGRAWQAAAIHQRQVANVVCDVVNLDDEEDQCPV